MIRRIPTLTAIFGLITLAACKVEPPKQTSALRADGDATPAPSATTPDVSFAITSSTTVAEHAEACYRAIGITAADVPHMSCLNGQPVPITFTNGSTEEAALTRTSWDAFRGTANNRRCDKPQWLEQGCYPYDLIQAVSIGSAGTAILNCRQKFFPDRDPGIVAAYPNAEERATLFNAGMTKAERLAFLRETLASSTSTAAQKAAATKFATFFDDLGLILRGNNGATCYFSRWGDQFFAFVPAPHAGSETALPNDEAYYNLLAEGLGDSVKEEPLRAALAPTKMTPQSPAKPYRANSAQYFYSPQQVGGGNCASCHTYGGYKWTPFIAQGGPSRLVPQIDGQDGPVYHVGSTFQTNFKTTSPIEVDVATWPSAQQGARRCTDCHRVVSRVETAAPSNANSFQVGGARFRRDGDNAFFWAVGVLPTSLRNLMTPGSLQYPRRAWMPRGHRFAGSGASAQAEFLQLNAVKAIRCCIQRPSAQGCKWKRFGPTPADVDADWRTGKLADATLEAQWKIGDHTEARFSCVDGSTAVTPPGLSLSEGDKGDGSTGELPSGEPTSGGKPSGDQPLASGDGSGLGGAGASGSGSGSGDTGEKVPLDDWSIENAVGELHLEEGDLAKENADTVWFE